MKLIHFKLETNYVIWRRYEGKTDKLFQEVWIPEDKIVKLYHDHNSNDDFYQVNEYYVNKQEFENVLKQLNYFDTDYSDKNLVNL